MKGSEDITFAWGEIDKAWYKGEDMVKKLGDKAWYKGGDIGDTLFRRRLLRWWTRGKTDAEETEGQRWRRRGTIAVDFALTALGPFRMLLAIIYFKQLLFKIIKNTE